MSLLMDALKKAAQSKQQQNPLVENSPVEHEINANAFTDGNAALSLESEHNHQPVKQNDDVSELLLDSEALEKELASIMAGSHASHESTDPEDPLEKKLEDHLVGDHLSLQLNLIDEHTVQESSSTVSDLMMDDNESDRLSFTVIGDVNHSQLDTNIMPVFGEDSPTELASAEQSATNSTPLSAESALPAYHNNSEKNVEEITLIDTSQEDKAASVIADPASSAQRATADRLLQTGKQPVAKQKNKYRLYGLLASLVLVLTGLGGGYVYYELNANSFTPALALPTRIDLKNRAPLLAPEAAVDAQTASPLASSQRDEVLIEQRTAVSSPTFVQPKKAMASPKKLIVPKTTMRQSTTEVAVAKKSSSKKTTAIVDKNRTTKKTVPSAASEKNRLEQHTVNATASLNPIHNLLLNGYHAYQQGDDVTARTNYLAVLQRENKNRDAMLGLAAIALREKKYAIAQDYYTRLLRVNPSDNVARGGLVSLLGELAPLQAESELKVLLSQEPGAAYLHFALGNIYVSQSRWADAQQAFFKSYSADSSHADYAYNLAVSLDFLGEHKAALNYYREALKLAHRKTVSFDISAVENRIHRLLRIVGGSLE